MRMPYIARHAHRTPHLMVFVREDRSDVCRNRLLLIRAHGTKARFCFGEFVSVLDTLITTTARLRIRRMLFHIYFIFSFNFSIHIESKRKIEFMSFVRYVVLSSI